MFIIMKPVSPKEIIDLNPALEYVNGRNLLNACKFSGNIGIGKFDPVVDS